MLESRSGRPIEVTEEWEMLTRAITQSLGWRRTIDQVVWALPIAATPTGVDDHFFHLKNDYTDKNVFVVDIFLYRAATSEQVEVLEATGTATSPTAITPLSWSVSTTKTPTVTAEQGADLQMTVTAANILTVATIDTTVSRFGNINYDTPMLLPPGAAITLNAVTGTSLLTGGALILVE